MFLLPDGCLSSSSGVFFSSPCHAGCWFPGACMAPGCFPLAAMLAASVLIFPKKQQKNSSAYQAKT